MIKEYKYQSVFAPYIGQFIEMHRSQGFSYNMSAYELYRFDCFCSDRGITEPVITKELFEAWAAFKPWGSKEGKQGLYSRMSRLRKLSLFMNMLQLLSIAVMSSSQEAAVFHD